MTSCVSPQDSWTDLIVLYVSVIEVRVRESHEYKFSVDRAT
jgi:hypothetical protein